uniref:Uncharacterized protein n=1 Tax=Solanum lycopersicum TaxID=4081 RepID=A0A3Q7GKA5_SOLLC
MSLEQVRKASNHCRSSQSIRKEAHSEANSDYYFRVLKINGIDHTYGQKKEIPSTLVPSLTDWLKWNSVQ